MRLRTNTVRDEVIRHRNQKLDRVWVYQHWSYDDRQAVLDAIRGSVIQELRDRDEREYHIPQSGSVLAATGEDGKLEADPIMSSQKHNGRDVGLETRRRFYAWMSMRPDPTHLYDWLAAIEDDDGKDARGHWLCGPHGGKRYTRAQMARNPELEYQTGFMDELPKWFSAKLPADAKEGTAPPAAKPAAKTK